MKATKKIVGAACALVAAVALSAGSTFAWFSTNSTVSAQGLTLGVDTSTEFLVIKGNKQGETTAFPPDLSTDQKIKDYLATYTTSDTSFNFKATDAKLKPSAHLDFKAGVLPGANTSWYYQTAASSTASTGDGTNKEITSGNLSKYVWKETVYITMLPDKGSATEVVGKNLEVTVDVDEPGSGKINSATTVVLVCGNNVIEYKWNPALKEGAGDYEYKGIDASTGSADQAATALTNPQLLDNEVKSTELTIVDIYVYYDGANTSVYTNNASVLEGATINFSFELKGDTPATT